MTPLNSAIGYEEAAAVAKQALKEHKTIRQTVIDRGLIGEKLSETELDRRLDVLAMAKVRDEGRPIGHCPRRTPRTPTLQPSVRARLGAGGCNVGRR